MKLFATKTGQKLSAIRRFRKIGRTLPEDLRSYVGKFLEILALVKGDTSMKNTEFELTPEEKRKWRCL